MSSSGAEPRAGKGLPCNRKLRRHERITEQFEYKEVIEKGAAVAGRRFKAYVLVNGSASRKAGFIAGKGVGNACARNRARRLLREAYRHLKPETRSVGFRAVFIAGRGMAGARSSQVESEMKSMLRSCKLLGGE
jgi:ribonuclease P protein component